MIDGVPSENLMIFSLTAREEKWLFEHATLPSKNVFQQPSMV
jgi:hypothetical protein